MSVATIRKINCNARKKKDLYKEKCNPTVTDTNETLSSKKTQINRIITTQ